MTGIVDMVLKLLDAGLAIGERIAAKQVQNIRSGRLRIEDRRKGRYRDPYQPKDRDRIFS